MFCFELRQMLDVFCLTNKYAWRRKELAPQGRCWFADASGKLPEVSTIWEEYFSPTAEELACAQDRDRINGILAENEIVEVCDSSEEADDNIDCIHDTMELCLGKNLRSKGPHSEVLYSANMQPDACLIAGRIEGARLMLCYRACFVFQ